MSSNTIDFPPEYVNYNDGPHVVRVMTAVIILATLFVTLRIIVRVHRHVGLGLDDWLSVASLVFLWAEYADGYLCIRKGGVGLHLPIALKTKPDALKNVFIVSNGSSTLFEMTVADLGYSTCLLANSCFSPALRSSS